MYENNDYSSDIHPDKVASIVADFYTNPINKKQIRDVFDDPSDLEVKTNANEGLFNTNDGSGRIFQVKLGPKQYLHKNMH
tara:strand:+ start:4488 stop:4727 length:240 start_codon:yes stop_codon:yes gene_type:complete